MHTQSELSCATDEQLASTHQIDLQTNEIDQLCKELCQLKVDKATLTERVQELTKEPSAVKMEMVVSSLSD